MRSKKKSICFPIELCEELEKQAKDTGKSFTDVVLDRLGTTNCIMVKEGSEIARLLSEVKDILLDSNNNVLVEQCNKVLEELVNVIYEIYEKYMEVEHNGNSEINQL